jgi:hypothetical protein
MAELEWTIDERFAAIASKNVMYRIMHPPAGKYIAIYIQGEPMGGTTNSENLGEVDTLEAAIALCEKKHESAPGVMASADLPTLSSAELLKARG